jgi:hypothetical protein
LAQGDISCRLQGRSLAMPSRKRRGAEAVAAPAPESKPAEEAAAEAAPESVSMGQAAESRQIGNDDIRSDPGPHIALEKFYPVNAIFQGLQGAAAAVAQRLMALERLLLNDPYYGLGSAESAPAEAPADLHGPKIEPTEVAAEAPAYLHLHVKAEVASVASDGYEGALTGEALEPDADVTPTSPADPDETAAAEAPSDQHGLKAVPSAPVKMEPREAATEPRRWSRSPFRSRSRPRIDGASAATAAIAATAEVADNRERAKAAKAKADRDMY